MKKTEMNKRELQERNLVVEILSKAGWEETVHSKRFNKGFWLYKEAVLDYSGQSFGMTIEYCAETKQLTFITVDEIEKGIILRIDFGEKLEEILNSIISFQSQITTDNYKIHIKEILKIAPKVFVFLNEDQGNVELLDTEE